MKKLGASYNLENISFNFVALLLRAKGYSNLYF